VLHSMYMSLCASCASMICSSMPASSHVVTICTSIRHRSEPGVPSHCVRSSSVIRRLKQLRHILDQMRRYPNNQSSPNLPSFPAHLQKYSTTALAAVHLISVSVCASAAASSCFEGWGGAGWSVSCSFDYGGGGDGPPNILCVWKRGLVGCGGGDFGVWMLKMT